MGDLISRKAVMELIESKCVDGVIGTEEEALIGAYGLITNITDLPTAYDVEKVVERLEEQMNNCGKGAFDKCIRIGYEQSIEIVKGGGQGE